ncbi:MAG: hypothetical protein KatS3mg077_3129 [Candidatus Binatia bacterium]|nr:MAG: hypothetical protein KatS3mg077_3129 [Candidatus Binatia bacterium]
MVNAFETALLLVLYGGLCFYLPGRAWSPWFFSKAGGDPTGPPTLFVELVASVVATTCLGLLLAEMGWWSPRVLALGLLVLTALGFFVSRKHPHGGYGRHDGMLVLVLLVIGCWLLPPYSARFFAADATGYLAASIHLRRSGSLVIRDSTVPSLDVDLRRVLFPSVAADRGSPPYLRLEGGYVLRSLDGDEVLPAFHHGVAPWGALAASLLGEDAIEWIFGLFGILALGALFRAASAVGLPTALAMGTVLLAATHPVVFFYARFAMPEMAAAFFLWSGVALLGHRGTAARLTALASAALGCAALLRLENAFFVPCGLLWLALKRRATCRASLLGPGLALCTYALAHTFIWRTHYWGNLVNFAFASDAGLASVLVIAAFSALYLWVRWPSREATAFVHRATAVVLVGVVLVALIAAQFHLRGGREWALMQAWSGWMFLPGGLLGIAMSTVIPPTDSRKLVLCFVLLSALVFFLVPNATPVDLWVLRRATPLLIPGLCLGLSVGAQVLWQAGGHRLARAVVPILFVVVLVTQLGRLLPLAQQPYYASGSRHLRVIDGALAPESVLMVHSAIAPMSFPPLLWALGERPLFYVSNPLDWTATELLHTLEASGKSIYFLQPSERPLYANPNARGLWRPQLRYKFAVASPFLLSLAGKQVPLHEVELSVYRWIPSRD